MKFRDRQDAIKTIASAQKFLTEIERKTPEQFGLNVAKRRSDLNITQFNLAKAVRLSRASVANIEAGRQWPTLPKFIRLCFTLRATPNELLGWENDR